MVTVEDLSETHMTVVYLFRDMSNGEFWIDIESDGKPFDKPIGPFSSEKERQSALDWLLNTTRSLGALDVPITNN